MKLTPYCIEMNIQTKATCVKAIERLTEEIRILTQEYARELSGLEARIKYCQEKIERIDKELAAGETSPI